MLEKIISYHLISIILLCSFEFGVTSHECSGKIVKSKIIFGSGNTTCGMKNNSDHKCEKGSFISKRCCKNHLTKFRFLQNLRSDALTISFDMPVLQNLFFAFYYTIYNESIQNKIARIKTSPPPNEFLTSISLPVLQVFRI